jgi:DNA-binding transcriptional regulator YiaG
MSEYEGKTKRPAFIPKYADEPGSPRHMVLRLRESAGMKPEQISEALGGRVSSRTVYRWGQGACIPHNKSDRAALALLYNEKVSE